jgi:hypothetical protein
MVTMGKIELISEYDKIISRLRAEGKVKEVEWTAEQERNWLKIVSEIRRESRYKQAMSAIEASKVILNA